MAYFEDGSRREVSKDSCEISRLYAKTPKKKRTAYDNIRRKMRNYEIYC
ncbi:MAG: hypothetical protein IJ120_06150 [Solobacterium sp.]|nr:hypothetical protein [Solobacterium sp.]